MVLASLALVILAPTAVAAEHDEGNDPICVEVAGHLFCLHTLA